MIRGQKSNFNAKASKIEKVKQDTRDLVKDAAWAAVVGGAKGGALGSLVLGTAVLAAGTTAVSAPFVMGLAGGMGILHGSNKFLESYSKERAERKAGKTPK